MNDDNQVEAAETWIDPRITDLRDEAERKFGLGSWIDDAYKTTTEIVMYPDGRGGACPYVMWGDSAGTYEAVLSHLSGVTMFMAGCENRHLGDERWLAFAIFINGLRGMTPQEVFDDLPSWRTADQ